MKRAGVKFALIVNKVVLRLILAVFFSVPLFIASDCAAADVTEKFSLSSSGDSRKEIQLDINTRTKIIIEAEWSGNAERLALILEGPGKNPAHSKKEGRSPLRLEYEVKKADVSKGNAWIASISNPIRKGKAAGTIKVTYAAVASGSLTKDQPSTGLSSGIKPSADKLPANSEAKSPWNNKPGRGAAGASASAEINSTAKSGGSTPSTSSWTLPQQVAKIGKPLGPSQAAPVISSFSPTKGKHGEELTITGKNMENVQEVRLGEHKLKIKSQKKNAIKAEVFGPVGAHNIVLVWNDGTVASSIPFYIVFDPQKSSLTTGSSQSSSGNSAEPKPKQWGAPSGSNSSSLTMPANQGGTSGPSSPSFGSSSVVSNQEQTSWSNAQSKSPQSGPSTPSQQTTGSLRSGTAKPPVSKPSGALLRKLSPQQWATKTVKLGEGVVFKLNDYVNITSFRKHPSIKAAFTPNYRKFLKSEPQYIEEVEETDDRVMVTRTLVLDTIDPCNPEMERQGLTLCFKQKKGKPNPETKKYLDDIRTKMRSRAFSSTSDPEFKKVQSYLAMTDEQLLDQLLNKEDKTKKIVFRSIVPYLVHEFRKVPEMDLNDMNRPLPMTNLFDFKAANIQAPVTNRNLSGVQVIPPTITSFSPERGTHKETITILGTNMDSVIEVFLVGKSGTAFPQTILNKSSDRIEIETLKAPPGESPHKIRLRWARGTVESIRTYTVFQIPEKLPPPVLGPYEFSDKASTSIEAKFLTGWTYGRRFGDYFSVQFAKETWFTDRYYAEFSYEITAGFGLRWPFEVKATSIVNKVYGPDYNPNSSVPRPVGKSGIYNYPAQTGQLCSGIVSWGEEAKKNAYLCAQGAEVKIHANKRNDSYFDTNFYSSTGLRQDQTFDGKEFVFELGLTCRFYASIPGPNLSASCPSSLRGFDFGRQLSPQLGSTRKDFVKFELEGRNIGLALDAGFGYIGFNPGIAIGGINGKLMLDIAGYASKPSLKTVTLSSFDKDEIVQVSEDKASGPWGIDLSNPRYSVAATLTPTISVSLGIDLGVYEWGKKFGPYPIDDLSIELGTATFERHETTKNTYEMRNIGFRPRSASGAAPAAYK